MYTIEDAHTKGVTALSLTSDCRHIISGGGEGQVRKCATRNIQDSIIVSSLFRHLGPRSVHSGF